MSYCYSNEIVFRGHPDKVCDQISDALLDAYMNGDKNSRCGIEVMGGKGKIFITGEVTSVATVDVKAVARKVLDAVGYAGEYEIVDNIGKQSPDIAQGVDIGGAGDQGMMFGYACRETDVYLPKAMVILQELVKYYDELRKKDTRFLPDGKAQITGIYNEAKELTAISEFTISYQNTEENRNETDAIIQAKAVEICRTYDIETVEKFNINPTGKFLIGGFEGDAGLTGRKIVVDNYQSFANVGGGAFSGKDVTKVDRSAAYKARQLAIRVLKENPDVDWCEIQLSYAIGKVKPLAVYCRTDRGYLEIPEIWYEECEPRRIIKDLDLLSVCFAETAQFGHFGNRKFTWENS